MIVINLSGLNSHFLTEVQVFGFFLFCFVLYYTLFTVFLTWIIKVSLYLTFLVHRCSKKLKNWSMETPPRVTCPTSVVVVMACCLVLKLCLKSHKSLSQLFVRAEVVENVACLGLSQGLVGQARWSGWSCLPSPFNRRSNTVANVMCNKTHFYCSHLWASE